MSGDDNLGETINSLAVDLGEDIRQAVVELNLRRNIEGDNLGGQTPPETESDDTSTIMTTLEQFLGAGNTVLATDRSSIEVAEGAKTYPKEERNDLKTKDNKGFHKMIEKCCEGTEVKFGLLTPISEDSDQERLDKTYSVITRLKQLKENIIESDMEDVFVIPTSFDSNGLPDKAESVNLLDTCHGVTMEQVKKATALYALKSSAGWHPQNILWSGKKILNSCESNLRDKIVEAAEEVKMELRGGPVYLFLMNDLIMATSAKAMRGLTDKLTSLKLTAFDGENVLKAGSYLKGALTLLRAHNKIPQDINLLLFQIFRKCSTTEFVDYVKSIESMLDTSQLFGQSLKLSPEDIINTLETKYSDLLGRDQWDAKSTSKDQGSAFSAETGKQDVICYNCGELGHIIPDCPKPKDDAAINARRNIITGNRNSSGGGGGNGRGRGGRGRGGRGRGGRGGRNGGRGGRGGSQTQNDNNDQNNANNKEKELKTPPKPGDSHKKTIQGKSLHWCGRCGKWDDHATQDHLTPTNNSDANTVPEGGMAIQVMLGAMGSNF